MTGLLMGAFAAAVLAMSLSGCVTLVQDTRGSTGQSASAPSAVPVPPPASHSGNGPNSPAPPKPSLSKAANRQRPHIDFCGAKIYADSISETQASGNVFLDGKELHQVNRSFPIAGYAGQAEVDLKREKVTLSEWPLVETDCAFIQAQDRDTAVVLSRDRMAKIKGPARYVIGTREGELFAP